MTPETDTDRRCTRCGVPDPDHPTAAKAGGVTVEPSGYCVACVDWRAERRSQAIPHLLARRRGQDGSQRRLTAYE